MGPSNSTPSSETTQVKRNSTKEVIFYKYYCHRCGNIIIKEAGTPFECGNDILRELPKGRARELEKIGVEIWREASWEPCKRCAGKK